MQPLIDVTELRSILEHGLVTGKWSIAQFNRGASQPVLPSREFLEENPLFVDMNLRDMDAFRRTHHSNPL